MLRRFASVLIGMLAAGLFLVAGTTNAFAQAGFFRWDIVSVATGKALPGGMASALANDGSMITLTGTGTFLAPPANARFSALVKSGSGSWKTPTASGTYRALVGPAAWKIAPGADPGNAAFHSGLIALEIVYSDGDKGILVVSCHLPGAPATVMEGITATKGFVDYWNKQAPVAGTDANRTVFTSIKR